MYFKRLDFSIVDRKDPTMGQVVVYSMIYGGKQTASRVLSVETETYKMIVLSVVLS